MNSTETDFLVIGGGSAGCAAAGTLAQHPDARTILLEAGTTNARRDIAEPSAWTRLFSSDLVWPYATVPQPGTLNRAHRWSMGRVLGGSSSVNAMIYMRGAPWDYDCWVELGCEGWDWQSVYTTYALLEGDVEREVTALGREGPIKLECASADHPLNSAFLSSCAERGYRHTSGFNGISPEGYGLYHLNMHGNRRQDAGSAFLGAVRDRARLAVLTETVAYCLKLDRAKRRVESVLVRQGSQSFAIRVREEVFVCAGAVASPQLLMLSGIGHPDELRLLDVRVNVPLFGVGSNLHDHVGVPVVFESQDTIPVSNYQGVEAGIYLRSDSEIDHFDAQIPMQHFRYPVENGQIDRTGYTLFGAILKPVSRGSIRLRSKDPTAAPLIDPGYLSEEADLDKLAHVVTASREIGHARAFDGIRRAEVHPGTGVRSKDEVRDYVQLHAQAYFHPVGTCKMGNDRYSVVDHRLKVQGLDNLRIADASIIPEIISGNTNAVSMMIGWRAARFALDDVRRREGQWSRA
jgi:choline dehydrogenase